MSDHGDPQPLAGHDAAHEPVYPSVGVGTVDGVRIGLVADTHVGEFIPTLPDEVCRHLAGCRLILHAGDHTNRTVVDTLRELAPVVAVRGDHDPPDINLPRRAVVSVGGWRIGLTHGDLGLPRDAALTAWQVALPRPRGWQWAVHRRLRRQFGAVDMIVYGHWHVPVVGHFDGVLMVNPGAVCAMGNLEDGSPPRRSPAGVADRAVRRFRTGNGIAAGHGSVAVCEITAHGPRVTHHRLTPES